MIAELAQWTVIIGSVGYLGYAGYQINKSRKKIKEMELAYAAALALIIEETRRKKQHNKILKRLTNPESIAEDMERGARAREMHDAKRSVLPREDAGPPAKVYSPKLRANLPRSYYKKKDD